VSLRKIWFCCILTDIIHKELTVLKVKLVLAVLISIVPINALRVLGYRLLGYKVSGRIGFGTVIAVSEARIEKCKLGLFNLFIGPMKVEIGADTSIRDRNTFSCGFWTIQEQYRDKDYARSLQIGANTLITTGHYFDVAGSFVLGDGSWIAGMGSQFWTHGAGVTDRDIRIGRDCYLGSAVRFAPGSGVGNHVIVAMGSVVTKKFELSKAMIGGVPAKVLKKDYDWKLEEKELGQV
jgi:acetyltransferase-like isoleucine patch superfamily enzyme